MIYSPIQVNVDNSQEGKLKNAIKNHRGVTIKVIISGHKKKTILFTKGQIAKIERAQLMGKQFIEIFLTARQVRVNTEHSGGFLATLASLASTVGPALVRGLASYAAAKGVEKLMDKTGHGLYLQKNGHCGKVQMVKGGGLYLNPHPRFHHAGQGLFEADESGVVRRRSGGTGLLLGDNSPFKNVPLLNILL